MPPSPSYIDRYPAKMVHHLASRLIDSYARKATRILDPFCGSGAVLVAAQRRRIPAYGIDLNPVAGLLTRVKLEGFDQRELVGLTEKLLDSAESGKSCLPMSLPNKCYWFTPATLAKIESIRGAASISDLWNSREGRALVLAFALSIRLCSRADQRSPKPFISKQARSSRVGRHYDPYTIINKIVEEISDHYGEQRQTTMTAFGRGDIVSDRKLIRFMPGTSHVITSPPYINAQDYFRNFKLELHALEGVLPFRVAELRDRFIGTERGDLLRPVTSLRISENIRMLPELPDLAKRKPRHAAIIHRYLSDMYHTFKQLSCHMNRKSTFVLVCGDNLVGGVHIATWQLLGSMLEQLGYCLQDRFADPIIDRVLAPKRCGHKGLIKEEVISVFERF